MNHHQQHYQVSAIAIATSSAAADVLHEPLFVSGKKTIAGYRCIRNAQCLVVKAAPQGRTCPVSSFSISSV
jgi:hypothetical protein